MTAPGGARDAVFDALADPTRRRLLTRVGELGSATASQLAAELPITRQGVSKHLAALADAGLVASAREGREVHFRVTPAPLSDAVTWMATVGAQWDGRLAALRRQLGAPDRARRESPR